MSATMWILQSPLCSGICGKRLLLIGSYRPRNASSEERFDGIFCPCLRHRLNGTISGRRYISLSFGTSYCGNIMLVLFPSDGHRNTDKKAHTWLHFGKQILPARTLSKTASNLLSTCKQLNFRAPRILPAVISFR